jgi:drug/metabolite transporter (DMT)-like permease
MLVTTYLSLVVTMLFWGGTFIAGRALAGTVPPANAAFLRFAIATVALAILTRLIDGKIPPPPRKQWLPLVFLGMTGVFSYNILFFTGLQHIEAGRASLIIALNPLAITLAAVLFLGDRLTCKQCCGIALSLIGAVFVISNGHPGVIFSGDFGVGEAAILGCVASWAAYSLIGRTVLVSLSPLAAVFYSSLAGTLLLFPFAWKNGSISSVLSYSTGDWMSLAFLGLFGTAVGFSLYYRAIRKIGAPRSSVFINLVPFFSILLSWLILGESIKPSVLTGGLLLLAGVYLTNCSFRK